MIRSVRQAFVADVATEVTSSERRETHWKESSAVKDSSQQSKTTKWTMKDTSVHSYRVKAEVSALSQSWEAPPPRELHEWRDFSNRQARGVTHDSRHAPRGDLSPGDADDRYALHDGPFYSVSHRFLRDFVALDAEGRSIRRMRGRPSTARVCRIAEQSILHSNGPFYPLSKTCVFLCILFLVCDSSCACCCLQGLTAPQGVLEAIYVISAGGGGLCDALRRSGTRILSAQP